MRESWEPCVITCLKTTCALAKKNLSSQRELNFAEVGRYSMKMKIWIVVLNCNFKSYVSGSADWSWQSLSPDASAEISLYITGGNDHVLATISYSRISLFLVWNFMERKLTKTCTIVTHTLKFFLFCFQRLKNDLTKRISLREVVCDLKAFATISDLRFLAIAFEIFDLFLIGQIGWHKIMEILFLIPAFISYLRSRFIALVKG